MQLIQYFNFITILLFGLIWIALVTFLRVKKRKPIVYLVFFTIFYIYFYKVLDYTIIQFQSLVLLKHFMPNLMLRGQEAGETLNLIPLFTLTAQDIKTSLLNILLFVPFGFGLPFITKFKITKIIIWGAVVSVSIEFLQLIIGLLSSITFRIADINDVLFNTLGVAIGTLLFLGFARLFNRLVHKSKSDNPFLRYLANKTQIHK